jgi:glycosyltransferase involved in cell wall biosynthesis
MSLISVVMPCYNEEENVDEAYRQVKEVFAGMTGYSYEHIFIDNASRDTTVEKIKRIAHEDRNVKLIVNARNFGHIRSPYYGLLQASGDAVILMVSDLQDPPAMILDFIRKWEEGYRIVIGVKTQSRETAAMFFIRKMFYKLIGKLSEIELIKNYTGFGLYDRKVIEILKKINDPYPYFRGLIADIGFKRAEIEYTQPARLRGFTKNNFYTLYDMAMLGITNHSKVPLRLMAMGGFLLAFLSLIVALLFFVAKLLFWNSFQLGTAPILIGIFFFGAIQAFFIGVLGEYIGSIHTQVRNMPLVVELERVNFEQK